MKFESGKFYKTRDGHKAVVWMPDNGMGNMLGAIKGTDGIWGAYVWCDDEKAGEYGLVSEWTEPKPPKLLAPALLRRLGSIRIFVTEELYASKEDAIEHAMEWAEVKFISWPAIPNKDGFYSVEEK